MSPFLQPLPEISRRIEVTAGYLFPYRPIKPRFAPMVAPSRYEQPNSELTTNLPTTYDSKRRTVDCIAATKNPHRSPYGLTVFRISRKAADLDGVDLGLVPVLDSHDHSKVLGKVVDAWFEDRQLHATLKFDKSPQGLYAASMVERGEIRSVSVGVSIRRFVDEDGNRVSTDLLNNPHCSTWGRDDGPRTLYATRWALDEISITSVPADKDARIL
jgi:phage head maturation protease